MYKVFTPMHHADFREQLGEIREKLHDFIIDAPQIGNCYCRVFVSDIINQEAELRASALYTDILTYIPHTIVQQPPADGSKINVLIGTDIMEGAVLHTLRLSEDEARGLDSYAQTMLLFSRYLSIIAEQGLTMARHLIRTWIFVADIDRNYAGVVRARNDIFAMHGLTADTHYVASTGIEGSTAACSSVVAIDFLTYPDISEADVQYLHATEYLNPTHEYGVAFERGTVVHMPECSEFYISGTASIDHHGNILHEGNVIEQAKRLFTNIRALLSDAGITMGHTYYFVVYLRDISDYDRVNEYMQTHFMRIPYVIVHAKVCRPGWLIEVEAYGRFKRME